MKNIFLMSLISEGVHVKRSIVGYLDSNDRAPIELFLKNRYHISLGEQHINRYSFQNGIHWEYGTDKDNVYVHIDIINKIE